MATELEVAYVQLLPSFRGFGRELEAGLNRQSAAFASAGRKASEQYAKGFQNGSAVSPAAASGAAAGFGASAAQQAGAAGEEAAAAFAAGLTTKGAAISAAGTALTAGVTVPLAAVGVLSARSAMGFESAFAGVRKTVDATETEFTQLSESIRGTANEIPVTREELAKIVELGGQFGLPNKDLMGFARTIADLGVTTNLTTEEGALMAAQFANITKMPTSDFDRFGATVANLGNNMSTQEDKIVEFGLRLAGQGSIIGLSTDQILAFSAALSSVGIMPEAGGTAFSRVFQRISDAVETGNDDLQTFADTTGLTVDKFEELYRSNPAELINQFVKGLSNVAASGATTPLLEELSLIDVRIRDSLQRLAGSNDVLGRAQSVAAEGWRENIALTEEAEKRYATTESQLQILKNRVGDVGVELGEALLPAINKTVKEFDPLIDFVGNTAEAFGRLPEGVQQTVLVTGLLAAAAGPAAALIGRISTALGTVAANSTVAAAGMMRYAGATNAAAAASARMASTSGAGNAAAGVGGIIPTKPIGGPTLTPIIAGSATRTVAVYAAAVWATTGAVNKFTGATDAQADAIDRVTGRLKDAKPAIEQFRELAQARTANWNPVSPDALNGLFRGEGTIDGVKLEFRDIDRAVQQVGESGDEALGQLRRQLIEQRAEVDRNSAEWEGLSYAIRQTYVEAGQDPPKLPPGKGVGAGIAQVQQQNIKALEYADGALRSYAASAEPAATGSEKLADSMGTIEAQAQFAAVGIDGAAAAAERYRTAVENAGSDDNILSAALKAGAAIRGLREGGGFIESEQQRKQAARELAVEQDRLATEMRDAMMSTDGFDDALKRLDPTMTALRISSEAAAAGAEAFAQSIEDSSSLDDMADSTLSLVDAYRDFRVSFRRLPADIALGADAFDQKLRPRQREAIRNVLALGDATTEYLQTLLRTGAGEAKVRAEADRLRASYVAQLAQLGLTSEQMDAYLQRLGLTPEAVDTAIRVSGLEESKAKLQAYIQLLEGKIPGSLAASVIATVESGDIEGAAKQLADFAATNPIDIPVTVKVDLPAITTAQDQLDELERKTLDLPQAYDAVTAALGGYTDAQQRGLEGLIAAGDEAQGVVAEYIAAGDFDGARAAAARFRDEFTKVLGEYGIVGDAANDYIDDLLQLNSIDVETNIKLSGIQDALTQIGLYQQILEQTGTTLPLEVAKLIAENLRDKNYEGVATILEQFTSGELGLTPLAPVDLPVEANTLPAESDVTYFRMTEEGKTVTLTHDAAMQLAKEGVRVYRITEEGDILTVTVGAETKPATDGVQAFRDYVAKQGPIVIPVVPGKVTTTDGTTYGSIDGAYNNRNNRAPRPPSDIDGNPYTPFSRGGLVRGPGTSTSDSILTRLSDGEYVLRADAVRAIGVRRLDRMNTGMVDAAATPVERPRIIPDNEQVWGIPELSQVYRDWFRRTHPGEPAPFGRAFATGGFVSGPGGPTADQVPARLSSGEFVMRAAAVRSLGVNFLDKLNKGYVPGFAMGGLVGTDAPAPARTSGAGFNYTVYEAKSHPRPEDLTRVGASAEFLAGGDWSDG